MNMKNVAIGIGIAAIALVAVLLIVQTKDCLYIGGHMAAHFPWPVCR